MMMTLLFVLLLAGLLLVWVLFWRQWQHDDSPPSPPHDERISPLLRGINYLLSDKPDLALQEMVQVARLRSEAADVYMALGEMFRSQGEIGRAVRIHQNILARPDVSQRLYLQAHFALAKDFQTGGLLDRALRHYQKVLDVRPDHLDALTASLRIREQSSEWLKAEELLSRIERLKGDEDSLHRAYLWCALAQDAMKAGDAAVAYEYVDHALSLAAHCGHAYILLIELALQHEDEEKLQASLLAIQDKAADYVHLLVPLLLHHAPCMEQLRVYYQKTEDHELALSWMEALAENEVSAAVDLREKLHFVSAGLRESLRLAAMGMNEDKCFVQQAKQWRLAMKHYHCEQCGVQIAEMRWQCPQCHQWGSMVALGAEES